jgi:hypothetical protein
MAFTFRFSREKEILPLAQFTVIRLAGLDPEGVALETWFAAAASARFDQAPTGIDRQFPVTPTSRTELDHVPENLGEGSVRRGGRTSLQPVMFFGFSPSASCSEWSSPPTGLCPARLQVSRAPPSSSLAF